MAEDVIELKKPVKLKKVGGNSFGFIVPFHHIEVGDLKPLEDYKLIIKLVK